MAFLLWLLLSLFLQLSGTNAPNMNATLLVLQVFTKDGCYYALDDNVLRAYQQLEGNGLCGAVEVDVVSRAVG